MMAIPLITTLYMGLIVLGLFVAVKTRKTRWPFKDTDKLLRAPGETLHKELLKLDEEFAFEVFGGLASTLLVFAVVGWVLITFASKQLVWVTRTVWIAPILSACYCTFRVVKLLKKRSSLFVGWFGERFAADQMRPLTQQGYRIFHDVPFQGGKGNYNIDHIVVGPTGVAVVEVKTYRKRKSQKGNVEHELRFDGNLLHFPWGARRQELDQLARAANSLSEWIFERTGLKVVPKQVLTFPSWLVRETPSPGVRVVNTKFLPDVIRGRGEIMLSPAQIDIISRQLEVQCRDVIS